MPPGFKPFTFPLRILIDGRTASAAELVAGALQDHGRARVLGDRSFGKGLVQSVFELSGGTALALTTGLLRDARRAPYPAVARLVRPIPARALRARRAGGRAARGRRAGPDRTSSSALAAGASSARQQFVPSSSPATLVGKRADLGAAFEPDNATLDDFQFLPLPEADSAFHLGMVILSGLHPFGAQAGGAEPHGRGGSGGTRFEIRRDLAVVAALGRTARGGALGGRRRGLPRPRVMQQ